jgi:DNA replication protein DnaC
VVALVKALACELPATLGLPQKWHDRIGEPTLADAILDRLVHRAHRIALKGPSRRKEQAVA